MAGDLTSLGGGQYSPLTGLIYIFNLIVGTGALTLPAAFHDAGWLLSSVIIIMLAFMSYLTATFVIESMAAANAMVYWNRLQSLKSIEIKEWRSTEMGWVMEGLPWPSFNMTILLFWWSDVDPGQGRGGNVRILDIVFSSSLKLPCTYLTLSPNWLHHLSPPYYFSSWTSFQSHLGLPPHFLINTGNQKTSQLSHFLSSIPIHWSVPSQAQSF